MERESYSPFSGTIAAISTPPGLSGIAVVRISGKDALPIARKIFSGKVIKPRYAHYGHIINGNTREYIDEVILTYFPAPDTYTGEDLVEISSHGGYSAPTKILEIILSRGARLAEPGEFTRRAFINGKMDLTQAEAVADLIHSRSITAHRLSMRILKGALRKQIESIHDKIFNIVTNLELELDFIDEEIDLSPKEEISAGLKEIKGEINTLLSTFQVGTIIREGASVPIIGNPNVGKSSILNAILKRERAIVTEFPGTTRDTIEEAVDIGGLLFKLIDTAGIRTPESPVEQEGINRTWQEIANAHLVIIVKDITEKDQILKQELIDRIGKRPYIIALNKIDIQGSRLETVKTDLAAPIIPVSAKTGENIKQLTEIMVTTLQNHYNIHPEWVSITHLRHRESLRCAGESIQLALEGVVKHVPSEYIVIDLRNALEALGEIVGKRTTEDILNNIFSKFCIGK
jgi:tRNA modification GTPase